MNPICWVIPQQTGTMPGCIWLPCLLLLVVESHMLNFHPRGPSAFFGSHARNRALLACVWFRECLSLPSHSARPRPKCPCRHFQPPARFAFLAMNGRASKVVASKLGSWTHENRVSLIPRSEPVSRFGGRCCCSWGPKPPSCSCSLGRIESLGRALTHWAPLGRFGKPRPEELLEKLLSVT